MADYNVFKRDDGWAVQREDGSRASALADTQAAAYDQARQFAANSGGGDVTVAGVDGQFRYKNTIAPAVDPRNIPG
jgi:hypothetical protein